MYIHIVREIIQLNGSSQFMLCYTADVACPVWSSMMIK